jgi:hypothetical protein
MENIMDMIFVIGSSDQRAMTNKIENNAVRLTSRYFPIFARTRAVVHRKRRIAVISKKSDVMRMQAGTTNPSNSSGL